MGYFGRSWFCCRLSCDSVLFQTSNWTHICVRCCDLTSILHGLSFEEILTNKISFEVLQFINDLYFKWTLIDGLVNWYDSHGKKHSSSSQEPKSSHTLYSNSLGVGIIFVWTRKVKKSLRDYPSLCFLSYFLCIHFFMGIFICKDMLSKILYDFQST